MTAHHPPDGPQNAAEATTAPDPIGDQGPVLGGAQRSTEGRAAIKPEGLSGQITEAVEMWLNLPDDLAANDEMARQIADVVMPIVQEAIDAAHPTQWAYDQACAALNKHRERAEQAEAERDRLKAAIEKAVRTENESGPSCEYGQPCPYIDDLEAALDLPEQP